MNRISGDQERTPRILVLLLFGGYALIALRLFHVQVTRADELSRDHDRISRRLEHVRGTSQFERGGRGGIFDARGNALALGYDTYRLVVDPNHVPRGRGGLELEERLEIAAGALESLGVAFDRDAFLELGRRRERVFRDAAGELQRIRSRRQVLIDGLMPSERDHLVAVFGDRDAPIGGFGFEPESERKYPGGDYANEIVGFVGRSADDLDDRPRGRAGIEYTLDGVLSGEEGVFQCERDGRGREYTLEGRWIRRPRDGRDVGLTIDLRFQAVLDAALRKLREEYPCEGASAIVLETATGRILAMRSLPVAGIEDLRKGDAEFRDTLSWAATRTYPPGSTFKPFIVARALEWGYVDWADTFDVTGGIRTFRHGRAARAVRDSHPHTVLSLEDVLAKSSNIACAMIGLERMGPDRLYDAIESFGFADKTGILLPSEPAGLITKREKIVSPLYFTTTASYGQGFSLTPLGLTARFSIFGNRGVYRPPVLVDWIGRGDERVRNERPAVAMVRPEVADAILGALTRAVTDGTARSLKGLPWSVAAKTGTAQIFDRRGTLMSYSSSLVALAPAERPRVTVYVGAHGIAPGSPAIYGGQVASGAVREILEAVLRMLGEPETRDRGAE